MVPSSILTHLLLADYCTCRAAIDSIQLTGFIHLVEILQYLLLPISMLALFLRLNIIYKYGKGRATLTAVTNEYTVPHGFVHNICDGIICVYITHNETAQTIFACIQRPLYHEFKPLAICHSIK